MIKNIIIIYIVFLISSILCCNNSNKICRKYKKNSDCFLNRSYEFNRCVIYSPLNKNKEEIRNCIKKTGNIYNINGTYYNEFLNCSNESLNINDNKNMERYKKEINLSLCLKKLKNISYYNEKIYCKKINKQNNFDIISKCFKFKITFKK